MNRWRNRLFLPALLAAALCVGGCGGDKKAEGSGPPKATPAPPIDTDQPEAAKGEPGAAVVQLWSRLRDGLVPLAVNAFDKDVVDAVGRDDFVSGLDVAQNTAASYAPKIVRTQPVRRASRKSGGQDPDLVLVYVEGEGMTGATSKFTFMVRRTPAGWRIVYDTLTDSSIRSAVATSRQFAPDEADRLSADAAAQAGAEASRAYKSAANDVAGRRVF